MHNSFGDEPIEDPFEEMDNTVFEEPGTLPEETDTPAAPPDPTPDALPLDHPSTDTGVDSSELYEVGYKRL